MNQPEIFSYQGSIVKNHMSDLSQFMGAITDRSPNYQFGLTPQDKDDPEWCIFMITAIKQADSSIRGSIVDFRVQMGFRIKEQGKNLTPELLFGLIVIAHHNLKDQFRKKHGNIDYLSMDEPDFNSMKNLLEIAINGQGTSLQ